jgi:hypothetical protein
MTPLLASALSLLASLAVVQDEDPGRSVHRAQLEELGDQLLVRTDDAVEASGPAGGSPVPSAPPSARERTPRDFIVFGYLQSEAQVYHLRWHALTHVGSRFVSFDAQGHLVGTSAFAGRSSYLKAGGAAQAAGVKVVLVVNNFDDSPGGTIEAVMTSPAKRGVLAGEIAALLASDDYSHGVSLDLEFAWGQQVRDGVTAFMTSLRAALDAVDPTLESSIYTNAIFSASQWDFDAVTGITPVIDYMLYSMYDWASGLTAHAISDLDNCLGTTRMRAYLADGLPPEKLVPVISAYSRRWNGTLVYGGVGSSSASSGFTDALYDVSLNPTFGGPYAEHYVPGDEAGWYAWNDGVPHVRTWEGLEGMEVEIRHALSMRDPGGDWNGRRLGGVGFWSLYWMAELTSHDPRTGATVARTRTYPHVYQLCHEILSPPATRRFLLDGFEGLDFRWRDPNEAPDTTGDVDLDSSRSLVPAPAGGAAFSTNAMRVVFDFEGSLGNRAVLAHEVLASTIAPGITDTNAVLGKFRPTSRLRALVHTAADHAQYGVRMLVVDAHGELEASPPQALAGSGWRALVWDLSGAGPVQPFLTAEPGLQSGDGVLDSARDGSPDVGFYGFAIEGDGPLHGEVIFDELTYSPSDPGGAYRINEFRYSDPAQEFVEVHGPAGPLPAGLQLRIFDSSDGSVRASIPLVGSIPDDGGGQGFFVAGDPAVPEVDSTYLFGASSDDIPNVDPSAIQLYHAAQGHPYDALVYEAFGGLDELVRPATLGVTSNGTPWLGEVASGTDASGVPYSMGRYPDGRDTRVNADDFSFQPASPGAPNGGTLALPATFDFDSPPARAFHTYGPLRVAGPVLAGLPPSSSGGLAWHCVDPVGGGVIGVLGDAALGRTGGFEVTGEVFVPTGAAPAQAIALGVCGSQGSNFFTPTAADRTGYESGYWLVYENRPGVGLSDGRADHPGVWELVHASHDNVDGEPVRLLAAELGTTLGVTPGQWVDFSFTVAPFGAEELVVRLNGYDVYRGPLPEDGPRSGAFLAGFRENHAGPPTVGEGTWVDGLSIQDV